MEIIAKRHHFRHLVSGLAKATENHFLKARQIPKTFRRRNDFFHGRIAVTNPQIIAIITAALVPYAKIAGIGAFVGQVDIQVAVQGIHVSILAVFLFFLVLTVVFPVILVVLIILVLVLLWILLILLLILLLALVLLVLSVLLVYSIAALLVFLLALPVLLFLGVLRVLSLLTILIFVLRLRVLLDRLLVLRVMRVITAVPTVAAFMATAFSTTALRVAVCVVWI